MELQAFDKLAIDSFFPIDPPRNKIGACYIISAIDYVTGWAEANPVKDCSAETILHFIFEKILTPFGCPKILMSDRGTHFMNEMIEDLIK